jgi:drug/metabolite transporter (DMT)-like permease
MMLPAANMLGILFALTSAAVWGAGDFTGGYASRRSSPYHVLLISGLSGLALLIGGAVLWGEGFPSAAGVLWAMLGGITGAVGIVTLYRALSQESAAGIAPTTAVIAAALPVLFRIFTAGLPAPLRMLGFGLALIGIWLVSGNGAQGGISQRGLLLACLAGVSFGGYFIAIGQVDPGFIFTPLIISRSMNLATGVILIRLNRLPWPSLISDRTALLAGILDAGGNLFYILAKQFTSLEIAAVLASLYPASTVVLARIVLKERISRLQWLGVSVCLIAIILITN